MKRSELYFTFILLPLDILATVLSFVLAFILRGRLDIADTIFSANLPEYIKLSMYFVPVLVIIYALSGLYYTRVSKGLAIEFYKIFEANSAALALLVLFLFFSKSSEFSRLILLFTWILSIILIYAERLTIHLIQKHLLKYGIGRRNVAVIGSNHAARFIASEINRNPREGYKFIGALDSAESGDIKILGPMTDFEEILTKNHIDEIVAIDSEVGKSRLVDLIDFCADHHITIKIVPNVADELSIKLTSGSIGSMPVLEIKTTALDGWGRIVKRILDVIISFVLLLVLLPLLVVIALMVKLTSKGPLFYAHTRVSRDNHTFKFFKFRSMYTEVCDWKEEGKWTTAKDNTTRVTPFGRFIRKTNLDELPQLWNILIGDMSFVGPRPELPKLVEKFSAENSEYLKRHRVKSGLTGWAQVNGLKGDTSIDERVRYDMYYIENWSIWFDVKIILRTAWLIIYEIFKGKYEYRADS